MPDVGAALCLEKHLHEGVGARVLRHMFRLGDVTEAKFFVEMDGARCLCVGFEIEAVSAQGASVINGECE